MQPTGAVGPAVRPRLNAWTALRLGWTESRKSLQLPGSSPNGFPNFQGRGYGRSPSEKQRNSAILQQAPVIGIRKPRSSEGDVVRVDQY